MPRSRPTPRCRAPASARAIASSSSAVTRARFAAAIVFAKGAKLVDDEATPDGAVVLAAGPRDWPRALARLAPGVSVALLDGEPAPASVDVARLVAGEAHLFGVVGGHPDLLPELVALVVRGALPLAGAVRRVSFADADAARAAYVADGGPLPIATP